MAAGGGGDAPPAFRSGAGAAAGIYYLSVRKGASFLCCTPLPGALDSSCCILGFSMCAVHPIGSTVIWLCCCCVLAVGTLANLTLQSELVSCPAADVSKQWSGRGGPVRSQRADEVARGSQSTMHGLALGLALCSSAALVPPAGRIASAPTACQRHAAVLMLRNFDSVEAIIFTRDSALDVSSGAIRSGASRIIAEAHEAGTLVAVLDPSDRPIDDSSPLRQHLAGAPCWPLGGSEPTIIEVSNLRKALNVDRPDGFGGSDGFGQAPGMAYGREPIASRCVVLVTTLQETAAALGAGMRAVAIPVVEGDWIDEELDGVADTCLDALGEEDDNLALRVADLSTPGAYWLNPALPRDLLGNKVDPDTGEAPTTKWEDEDDEAALRDAFSDVKLRPPPPPSPPPPPLRRRSSPPRMALEIDPADAAALLLARSATLLDVRQPGEYRLDGHVDGSENIAAYTWEHGFYLPKEGFAEEVAAEHAADAPLVIMCADGMLSKGAAAVLEGAAFTNVQTLNGGLRAWEAEAEEDEGVPPLTVDEDGEGGLTGAWV